MRKAATKDIIPAPIKTVAKPNLLAKYPPKNPVTPEERPSMVLSKDQSKAILLLSKCLEKIADQEGL